MWEIPGLVPAAAAADPPAVMQKLPTGKRAGGRGSLCTFGSGGQRNTFSFAVLKLGFDVVVSVVVPVRVVGEAGGGVGP